MLEQLTEEEEKQQSLAPEYVKVSLNTATAQDLQAISGIGPTLSERIVEYRRNVGGFLSKDELLAVPGIGPALYDSITDHVTVVPPDEVIGAEAVVEPLEPTDAHVRAEPEVFAAPSAVLPEQPAPRPPVVSREGAPGLGLGWVWSALVGGLLGVIATLLILSALNGSLVLHRAPVIVDMSSRIDGLAAEMGDVRGDLDAAQQRLTVLESLPSRMDAVEASVGQLDTRVGELGTAVSKLDEAVSDLRGRTDTLANRVDEAEEDIVAVEQRANRVDGFFLQLQSLLSDVFGPVLEPGE